MEYFRRLLGTLQEALDYVSSFTTYLLGNEAHPGAEESGNTRETRHRSSCHDPEVELAHAGDISPGGHREAFEGPLTTEETPPNQETGVTSEAVVSGAQDTEDILEPSRLASEGQEEAGQLLTESPQFSADAQEPRPTTTVTGSIQQRDLERAAVTGGLHQWEPEGPTWLAAGHPGALEEVGPDTENSQHSESDRPLTGEKVQGNPEGATEIERLLQKEQEASLWKDRAEQRGPDWALFLGEQQNGLEEPTWPGGFEQGRSEEVAKMAEKEVEQKGVAEAEGGPRGQSDIVVANERIPLIMLEEAETEGDQEVLLEEEEEVGRSHWRETEGCAVLLEQEWDPKEGGEERNGQWSRLGEAEGTEGHQQGELEGPVRNGGDGKGEEQEEQMGGVWEGESERLGGGGGGGGGVMLEEADTRGGQQREQEGTAKSLQQEPMQYSASLNICAFAGQQTEGVWEAEPEKLVEAEGLEEEVLEVTDTRGVQPWEAERNLQQEPTGSSLSLDIGLLAGGQTEAERLTVEGERLIGGGGEEEEEEEEEEELEVAETRGHQPWEPEGTEGRLQQKPTGNSASFDTCPSAGVQTGGVWEEEPEKLVEVKGPEEEMLEEADTRGGQQREQEGTAKSLQQEPMQYSASLNICAFAGQQTEGVWEAKPEKLVEAEGLEEEVLEVTDTRGVQPWEAERNLQLEPTGSSLSLDIGLLAGGQTEAERLTVEGERLTVEGERLRGGGGGGGEEEEEEEEELEVAETRWHQPWEPEGTEGRLQQKPMGNSASFDICPSAGVQTGGVWEEEPEKLVEVKGPEEEMLEEADTRVHQPCEPEETGRRLQQEPMGSCAALDICLFSEEQTEGEPERLIEEGEGEGEEEEEEEGVMLEEAKTRVHQPWEPGEAEGSLQQEPPRDSGTLDRCMFPAEQRKGEPERLVEAEGLEEEVLEETETREHQPWETEEAGRSLWPELTGSGASLNICPFAGEQTEGESERLTEERKGGGGRGKEEEEGKGEEALVMLDEAEARMYQPWEPEGAESSLQQEPSGNCASLEICPFAGEQIERDPVRLREGEGEGRESVVLEEAETRGGQPWEPEEAERHLQEEPMESSTSLDKYPFAGPRRFPDEVLPLDTSAQKERVLLRRKSSIRRAPSLKKPRLPAETQPPKGDIAEATPSPPPPPSRPTPRHAGFGPMHPNMMAELQMRLRKPQ
ncbi:filaggrin-2-like [Hemicordylus capensis]|uniref:filaggrin-2-like n=1 Tax=Hemicordylus capensis TaxID=884348 RepID=UPI0023048393|nr:filaggrin-2-like [Hemicordylus capensis]